MLVHLYKIMEFMVIFVSFLLIVPNFFSDAIMQDDNPLRIEERETDLHEDRRVILPF